jgi:formylglycine-generating enzyme required for sulfatase activity
MLGNVWEWVQDNGHENYDRAPTDGSAGKCRKCSSRINRGGSWDNFPISCRSASRTDDEADFRAKTLGLRIMKVL